jgi:hypothetical protein
MELSSERKLQLCDEAQAKAEVKQLRTRYFLYVGVIAATVAIATVLAHLAR